MAIAGRAALLLRNEFPDKRPSGKEELPAPGCTRAPVVKSTPEFAVRAYAENNDKFTNLNTPPNGGKLQVYRWGFLRLASETFGKLFFVHPRRGSNRRRRAIFRIFADYLKAGMYRLRFA
jgi:hypothetical protein